MEKAAAGWIPIEFAIGLIVILLLMLQGLAVWRWKRVEDAVTKLVDESHAVKAALASLAPISMVTDIKHATKESVTAMGERMTAANHATAAEQNRVITKLAQDFAVLQKVVEMKDRT